MFYDRDTCGEKARMRWSCHIPHIVYVRAVNADERYLRLHEKYASFIRQKGAST